MSSMPVWMCDRRQKLPKLHLCLQVHEYPWLWGNYPFEDFKRYSEALDKAW
jgi:hypothetical protein